MNSLRNLRISDLELFITAAHFQSLGKAAKHHHLSQSAASAAVQRVESAFERLLCTHEKRRFQLTHEGQVLIPRAEAWIKQLRDEVASEAPRPIRFATTHAMSRVVVPAILSVDTIDLKLVRPDIAYGMILRDEADMALVLDNAPWEGVIATEVGKVSFGLYSCNPEASEGPVLMPEEQMEVLAMEQRWAQIYDHPLEIKARLPSWSLIADICSGSDEIGFLPDFLALHLGLHPVSWQPSSSGYRMLVLYRKTGKTFLKRLTQLISVIKDQLGISYTNRPINCSKMM